jgi:hypothetical protein
VLDSRGGGDGWESWGNLNKTYIKPDRRDRFFYLINFNKLLNKWTKTINITCLSPLIELTNHMRSHSVWLSTAPKLEKCVTCPRSISKNQTLSGWNSLCLCHVCDEEELQLIFLEDSGTLEYSTCILLQRLCVLNLEAYQCWIQGEGVMVESLGGI